MRAILYGLMFLVTALVCGCSKPPQATRYDNVQVVDGWTVRTYKAGADNDGYITIGMGSDEMVTILNRHDEGKGRHVIVHEFGQEANEVGPDVEIIDWEPDGVFDRVSIWGSRFWAIDHDYDGRPDELHDGTDESIQILFAGAWHKLQYEGSKVFIVNDGREIELTVIDNNIVPVPEE